MNNPDGRVIKVRPQATDHHGSEHDAAAAPEAAPMSSATYRSGRVGVVDIGSNTVRLVVYEGATRLPIPVFNEKVQCELAAGLGKTGRLNPRGIKEATRSLKRFVRLSQAMEVERLEMVATAAVRDAEDGTAFVEAAGKECGYPIHVLTGAEEARLAAVGILNGTPCADGLLGDLGGGSLDFVELEDGRVKQFATLPLGHIRLAEQSDGNREKARTILNDQLSKVPWLREVAGRSFYVVGGTWRALARVFIDQLAHPLHVVDGFAIDFLNAFRLANLISGLSETTLERFQGIDAKRRLSLPFGAAALAAVLEIARPRQVVFSAYSMREGQMLELLEPELRLQDPLISACERQAERNGRFAVHGQEILEWTDPLFENEPPDERRLRLAACLLSDIGWNEHPDYRALHAFHRVLRVPYPGLSHSDRAQMALTVLIRYGGNEADRMVAPLYTLLDEQRISHARTAGLALRLAHTLTGGAPGLLAQTRIVLGKDSLSLITPANDALYTSDAIDRRFAALAKAMQRTGRIETEDK